VRLPGNSNLHSYWDSRLGSGESDRFLAQLATTIQRRHPAPQRLDMDPTRWAQEGLGLKEEVYAFTGGSNTNPARLGDAYSVKARETACTSGACGVSIGAVPQRAVQVAVCKQR